MSKATILSLISRVERIADMIPSVTSEAEANALGGQVSGTLAGIKREFAKHGISVDDPLLAKWGKRLERSGDPYDAQHALHLAAGYLRALTEEID